MNVIMIRASDLAPIHRWPAEGNSHLIRCKNHDMIGPPINYNCDDDVDGHDDDESKPPTRMDLHFTTVMTMLGDNHPTDNYNNRNEQY